MTIARRLRLELLVGPSTGPELAAAIGSTTRRVSSHLSMLIRYGHVRHFTRKPINIYELTPRGRMLANSESRFPRNVHTDPVSVRQTQSHVRPVAAISGVKRLNKPLKPLQAGCGFDGQDAVLQTIIPAAPVSMGKTGEMA